MAAPPRVLTIAGSDPSGGAGLQADLKTFQALGCYGMAAVSALTAQNTVGVRGVHAPPPEFLNQQISAIVDDCPPVATKTGMLHSVAVIEVVAHWAEQGVLGQLVVDPVMVATSGDRLLRADAEAALRDRLLPLAVVTTPNLEEAGVLLGRDVVAAGSAEQQVAMDLSASVACSVLVKGGHRRDRDLLRDVLGRRGTVLGCWEHERLPIAESHGTGCTLSAALAAGLALGAPLETAVGDAIAFVQRGLGAAFPVGHGAVPVNHLCAATTSRSRAR